MSKNRRRQRRGSSFPWPVMAFGAILLIVAAVLFARKSSGAPAAAADGGSGSAKISVDEAKIDYGYVKFGNNKTFKIKVTNTGGGPLRFAEDPSIEVLEGC